MKRPRIIIAGVGLAAPGAAGGITATSESDSTPTTATGAATTNRASATVRTATATVAGKTEEILVNSQGLPRYIYWPDTATRSLATGGRAQLWPPLTSPAIAGAGVTGKLAVLKDVNGRQFTCNGHPLYTFADDYAGQGVQNFLVATPGIASITVSAASTAPTTPSGVYGY